jgi:hypothetical protein
MTGFAELLTKISLGFPIPFDAGLLIPVTAALLQANVVPAVPLAGTYENSVLLQIGSGVSSLVNVGIGLTLTVIFRVWLHPLAVKV